MWDFRTKFAVVIASETLKSIIFCNVLSVYINIVKSQYTCTRSERVIYTGVYNFSMLSVSCSWWQGHVAVHQESHRCSLLLQPGLVYWEPHPWPWYVCQEWCRVSSLTMQHYCLNFRIIIQRSNNLKCYENVIFNLYVLHSLVILQMWNQIILYLKFECIGEGFTRLGWCDYFIIYFYLKKKFDKFDYIRYEIRSIN